MKHVVHIPKQNAYAFILAANDCGIKLVKVIIGEKFRFESEEPLGEVVRRMHELNRDTQTKAGDDSRPSA